LFPLNDLEKVADVVPSNYFTRCAPGERYEMAFPKVANMKPPKGSQYLLRGFFISWSSINPNRLNCKGG